jgi:hypothetical protein
VKIAVNNSQNAIWATGLFLVQLSVLMAVTVIVEKFVVQQSGAREIDK